ncbi:hypothetical protein COO60DRAFT_1701001, partial [Scenedesmus sp. NREL 46B-D3]
ERGGRRRSSSSSSRLGALVCLVLVNCCVCGAVQRFLVLYRSCVSVFGWFGLSCGVLVPVAVQSAPHTAHFGGQELCKLQLLLWAVWH